MAKITRNHTILLLCAIWACLGCSTLPSKESTGEDLGDPDSDELRAAAKFWNEVAICGTPAEEYADIVHAADAADAVVLGQLADVTLGNTVQTDAEEDFYAEANITVEVVETLRNSIDARPVVSLVLTQSSAETVLRTVETMRTHLPQETLVLLLHLRTDSRERASLYRPDGAFMGLWTRTLRGAVDNPLTHDRCVDYVGSEIQSSYLKGVNSVDELAALLRD